jgi:hypothetical protein
MGRPRFRFGGSVIRFFLGCDVALVDAELKPHVLQRFEERTPDDLFSIGNPIKKGGVERKCHSLEREPARVASEELLRSLVKEFPWRIKLAEVDVCIGFRIAVSH